MESYVVNGDEFGGAGEQEFRTDAAVIVAPPLSLRRDGDVRFAVTH